MISMIRTSKKIWKEPPGYTQFDHYTMPTERGEQEIMEDINIINAEIIFPKGDYPQQMGNVTKIKQDAYGNFIFQKNDNPMLDRPEYIVHYPDGSEDARISTNIMEHL